MDIDDGENDSARATKRRKAGDDRTGIVSSQTSNGSVPSLLSRLGSASPAPNSSTSAINFSQTQPNGGAMAGRIGGPIVHAFGNVKRSGSGGDAARTTAHTNLRGKFSQRALTCACVDVYPCLFITGSMRAASASRDHTGQTAPASVGVGGGFSRSNISTFGLNGDIDNGVRAQTLRMDVRQASSMNAKEPMEISILGASGPTNDSDEIKIRGAAERRNGGDDDNVSGARGGLSLLARLSDGGFGGGSANDQGNGRKRKLLNRM